MSRAALARAYRPRRFSEVATQEHVSATLRSAVQRGRVAHAYLFCGPRGVGKTTLARVLAMALNCPNRTAEGEPCAECDSCRRIWAGKTSLDVVEIDAASNRGVDDARDLRERAMYAPSEHDRYKIYIIDEAHMLTREAWNALLKILEEPPPRVIFVFATTEPQKIQQAAPPILSRCQRFDFHRIGTADLVRRMREVLAGEGAEAADDVLLPIAQKADGGMRDALSLLDQVLSFTEGAPGAEDVRRVLGLVGDELYLELMEIIAERRHAEVFAFVNRLLHDGYDLAEFYRGLADFLRALLMVKLQGPDAAEIRDDLRPEYAARADRFAAGDLLRMLSQVAELDADGRFRKSGQQQILIELLLLRFSYLDRTVEIEDVLSALGGAPPAPRDAPAVREPRAPDPSPRRAAATEGSPPADAPAPAPRPAEPPRREDAPRAEAPPAPAAGGEPDDRPGAGAPPTGSPVSGASHAPAASPSAPAPVTDRHGNAAPTSAPAPPPSPVAGRDDDGPAPEPPARMAEPEPSAGPLDLQAVRRAWRSLLEDGDGVPAGMSVFLRPAHISVDGDSGVRVGVPTGSPALDRMQNRPARRGLEEALEKRLGRSVSVAFAELDAPADAAPRITAETARAERLRRLAEDEPILAAAVREWDLELIDDD